MNDNFTGGLDIHLFVEYISRDGKLNTYDLPHVRTMWGRPYTMNLADVRKELPFVEYAVYNEKHVYFNKMVDSLASACNMRNTRISVTVFNSNELVMVQSPTNKIDLLRNCTSDKTFKYKDNGGKICGDSGKYGSVVEEEFILRPLGDYISEIKAESPNRKHVVIFVSECFPECKEYARKSYREIFNKWKMNNIEFITLRLNNPCVIYSYDTMNYDVYKELSTVPEWTKVGDYNKICFLLSLIGKKLSDIDTSKMIQGLDNVVKEDVKYLLDKEENDYDQQVEDEKRRKKEEHDAWLQAEEEKAKKKDPLAYLAFISAILAIIFLLRENEVFIFFSITSLVSGHMGKESTHEILSRIGFIIGILGVILTVVAMLD